MPTRHKPAPPGRVPVPRGGKGAAPRVLSAVALVCAGVALAHWPALSAQAFSLDDPQYVLENPLVRNPSWSAAARFLREVRKPSTVAGYYQPLTMISLMLDTALGGRPDDLRVYHRTSLALHVANTALILLLLYRLFGSVLAAAATALLFGVHPLTVEPVPWVAERKTLLAAFFALACLGMYVSYTQRRTWPRYAGCAALYLLALLSKPTTTPLPLLLVLVDYWPLRRLSWRSVTEKIPLLIIGVASAVVTILSQRSAAGLASPTGYDPLRVGLTICHNLVFYLRTIVWPVGLTWHYPFPEPFALSQPAVLAGVIGTPLLLVTLAISWRWTRALLVGGLFFIVALLPTLNIVGFTYIIAAHKFTYLPVVGLLLPLNAWLARLLSAPAHRPAYAWRLVLGGTLLALAALEAHATRGYLDAWQDTERLYRYMLDRTPQAYAVRYNLGVFLERQKRVDEAVREYQHVIAQRPDHWRAQAALGNIFVQRAQPAEALPYLDAAVRLKPNDVGACRNLGFALAALGRTAEAVTHYQRVRALDPSDVWVRLSLGRALAAGNRFEEALACYDEALRLNPASARAHFDRGVALGRMNRAEEAVAEYRRALEIEPDYAAAREQLEATLRWLGARQDR